MTRTLLVFGWILWAVSWLPNMQPLVWVALALFIVALTITITEE